MYQKKYIMITQITRITATTKKPWKQNTWPVSQNAGIPTHLKQWSPIFLAPEMGFLEDNFSRDRGGGNVGNGEQQMKLHLPVAHLLLCGLGS